MLRSVGGAAGSVASGVCVGVCACACVRVVSGGSILTNSYFQIIKMSVGESSSFTFFSFPTFHKNIHTKTDWAVDLYDVTKGSGRSFHPVLYPVPIVPPSGTTSFQTRRRSNPSSASQKAVNRGLTVVCALFWKIWTWKTSLSRKGNWKTHGVKVLSLHLHQALHAGRCWKKKERNAITSRKIYFVWRKIHRAHAECVCVCVWLQTFLSISPGRRQCRSDRGAVLERGTAAAAAVALLWLWVQARREQTAKPKCS